jgi:hypothetical protein
MELHVAAMVAITQEEPIRETPLPPQGPSYLTTLFQVDAGSQKLLESQLIGSLFAGIVDAKSRSECSGKLELALLSLNDYKVDDFDRLVRNGSVNFLALCLRTCLNESTSSSAKEIGGFCRLIQSLVLGCSDACASSYIEMNGADLIFAMVHALIEGTSFLEHDSEKKDNAYRTSSWWQDTSSSILSTIDRVSNSSISLSEMHRSNELITFLHFILCDIESHRPIVHHEALKILAGLTRHPGSFFLDSPGVVDGVLSSANKICNHAISPAASVTQSFYIIQLLRRLSNDVRSTAVLVQKKHCLKLLLHFSTAGDLAVRREALMTLVHISQCKDGSRALLSNKYKQSIEALTCTVATENTELQCLVLQIMLQLVKSSKAKRLVQSGRLQQSLSEIARSTNTCAIVAARLIKRLASYVSVRDLGHAELIDAIVELTASEHAQIRLLAAKSFFQQSCEVTNRFLLARSPNAMKVIITLTGDSGSDAVRAVASEALFKFASNYKHLAYDSRLLPTLVKNLEKLDFGNEWSAQAARCSVQAILTLAEHRSARERIAKQLGLLANLSKYAMSGDTDVELKKDALRGVIVLVPFI